MTAFQWITGVFSMLVVLGLAAGFVLWILTLTGVIKPRKSIRGFEVVGSAPRTEGSEDAGASPTASASETVSTDPGRDA
jgi:hypothetical protein